MAQLRCLCGYQMSNVASPADHVFYLVSDAQAEDASVHMPRDIVLDSPEMWVCRECGNLAISRVDEAAVRWFVPHGPIDTLAWLRMKPPAR